MLTQDQIDMRIRLLQSQLVGNVHASTLCMINNCISKLIMMEATPSEEVEA